MNKRSSVTMILLVIGLLLSVSAILIGVCFLVLAFGAFYPMYDNYVVYGFTWTFGLGLVLLTSGLLGLRACIRRTNGKVETADLPPPERRTILLEPLQTRVAAGLCPKCGAHVAPTDQNCPSCRINLAWAREHLEELAG